MLNIEGELQSKVTLNLVYAAVVWAIQVDGSLSRTMRDNKFVIARIIDKDLNMKTVFLSVDVPQARGAEGLLEIVKAIINSFGLDKLKLVGVTTDGESANTGRRNGFWKLLRTYLDRDIFSFWCCSSIRSRCKRHGACCSRTPAVKSERIGGGKLLQNKQKS